jgi:hypothetical protein
LGPAYTRSPSKSKESHWVLVEAGAAWGLKKHILPVLRNVQPEEVHYLIGKHQWRFGETDEQLDSLIDEISTRGSIDKQFGEPDFDRIARAHCFSTIDEEQRRKNLAKWDWRYDILLKQLANNGWVRFAAGFKAGLYANREKEWCLKIMGMGIGDNPAYFAGRGYYVSHERGMLQEFARADFLFQPRVKSIDESIAFLVDECGIEKAQAEWQCRNDHILITERILGVPFATQTGNYLNYDPDIAIFDSIILRKAEVALERLQHQLNQANTQGLLHNDPMPSNILFTQDENHGLIARLVDFELAQKIGGFIPPYVRDSVTELRDKRQVPQNRNLDQHLMDQAIQSLSFIRRTIEDMENSPIHFGRFSFIVPFFLGSMSVGEAIEFWNKRIHGY